MDLTRHTVFEASAGTGKTYTIEQIVSRLLVEGIELQQLLIVTFTEKATGELRARLRKRIEQDHAQRPEKAALLRKALDSFDQAAISTIHAFCHNLLREFPLEQGQEFALKLTPRQQLVRPALRAVERTLWPRQFGPDLAAALQAADYDVARWEKEIVAVAGRYRPGALLRPHHDEGAAWTGPAIAAGAVDATVAEMRREQERRGLFTFDDMIERVAEALDPEMNPSAALIAKRLRGRFRYAIVDEFQDTDPVQWDIFRRVFLEGENNLLFLVGDPKQAIFGFRGADLPTYLKARDEVMQKYGGVVRPLTENWRAIPNLLTGLNRLFQASGWYADPATAQPGDIAYVPVSPPERPQTQIEHDATGTAPLNVVDVSAATRLADARRRNSVFVAEEIARLLSAPEKLIFQRKGKTKPLEASDIAVLVFRRGEAATLTKELRRRRVPFSFYRQMGLWKKSPEAFQVGCLLDALACPDDAAMLRRLLLTHIFRISPTELAADRDLPDHHPARLLFERWLEMAEERSWASLFRSLLEDSALLRHDDPGDLDRPLANLRRILGDLEQAAYRDSLDIHGLLAFFRRQQSRPDADEQDFEPIETQAPKVQIMTVHASKGLEYPIVFLAGGFTTKLDFGPISVAEYRDEANRRVLHFGPDDSAKDAHKQQRQKEDHRLLYVALTRAMLKLYLPMVRTEKGEPAARYPGPLCSLLRPALENAQLEQLGKDFVTTFDGTPKLAPPTVLPAPPFHEEGASLPGRQRKARAQSSETPEGEALLIADPLFPRLTAGFSKRRIALASFSSLARRDPVEPEVFFGDAGELPTDDEPDTDEGDSLRGPVFGDLVHRVLERIDMEEVRAAAGLETLWREGSPARMLLEREVTHALPTLHTRIHDPRTACETQVARLVWLALRTSFTQLGVAIADVKDLLREVEFLFPYERSPEEGFLTGFIDMILRHEGRYYLLDWKTNVLDAYDRATMTEAMREADYVRQYRLYAVALERWLSRVLGPEFSFASHFGGVFYIFLRGLNGRDDAEGVFFVKPDAAELTLQNVLSH
ncbi:MAG: UvrD-helicase domain-containing protein [Gemmataceae bacterium]